MKTLNFSLQTILLAIITILALSCTKQPVIEYDLYGIEGKWIVTSTSGKIIIGHDTVFAINDTVRFYKIFDNPNTPIFFVSRPKENRYYDEKREIHYYLSHGYGIKEDRLTFEIFADHLYNFELLESKKEHIVFQFKNNGATAILKKEE